MANIGDAVQDKTPVTTGDLYKRTTDGVNASYTPQPIRTALAVFNDYFLPKMDEQYEEELFHEMVLTKKQLMTSSLDSKNKQYCVDFAQKSRINK